MSSDVPYARDDLQYTRLGAGVGIYRFDRLTISDRPLYDLLVETARRHEFPYQVTMWGGTDASAMQPQSRRCFGVHGRGAGALHAVHGTACPLAKHRGQRRPHAPLSRAGARACRTLSTNRWCDPLNGPAWHGGSAETTTSLGLFRTRRARFGQRPPAGNSVRDGCISRGIES